jgi:asparagine synthetase B (glutamine-hydrolysing)
MPMPPLANLFALHDPDPAALEAARRDLQSSGEFASVWRPAPGWVAAALPLPGGLPDDELVRGRGFAFAEGRDLLVDDAGQDPRDALQGVAELADRNPDRLASLPGDFGFIRFRPGGEATVVRSCGGLVPFYLWDDPHPRPLSLDGGGEKRAAIATRLGDLVRYLPDEFALDPLPNAIWAASWPIFPDNRTFLKGVSILPRGHFARLGSGDSESRPYWQPRPPELPYPKPAQVREHAERLRAILIAKLKRDLDPEGGNLLAWSGGVDSSSLAALAAGVVGRKVWTFTVLPSLENPAALAHELSFIAPLAEEYGLERRWEIHLHARLMLDLWRAASPVVFHIVHPALCSLPRMAQEAPQRLSVLFGGEYADELCGSKFTLPDWARHTSPTRLFLQDIPLALSRPRAVFGPWLRQRRAARRGAAGLVFPRPALEMELSSQQPLAIFHPALCAEYEAWWEGRRQAVLQDPAPWRHLALNSATIDAFVPMSWEACSALGVRRSFPFFNREIFELAFACHPAEMYGPGPKKLLRRALHGDVPHHNLYREDKGRRDDPLRQSFQGWQEPFPIKNLPEELAGVLEPAWFANPPARLDYWPYRCLARLLIFTNSLRARKETRPSSYATS